MPPAALSLTFELPIVAVLRGREPRTTVALAHAAFDGGLTAVEITMDSPGAADAIAQVAAEGPTGSAVGAGTIRSVADLDAAVDAGATFVVAPHLDVAVVEHALGRAVPIVPGVVTPTELITAFAAGAAMVKLFPAGPLGTSYLQALRGPFPDVPIMVTGGIELPEAGAWISAGATCVGVGSSLGSTAAEVSARLAGAMPRVREAVAASR